MSVELVGAVAVAVISGAVTLLNTMLGIRARRAKDEVAASKATASTYNAQVDTAVKAMKSMESLADRLQRRIDELETDLEEERATSAALGRLVDRLRGLQNGE